MSQATDPRLGTTLGGYRIDSLIGRGGMSVVYLAEDLHLGRKVALKFLAPELVLDDKFRERFVRESRLAASLEHPNIVTVYDAREADGQLYLAMRYVAGTDLKRLIASEGALDTARAVSILFQAASALDAAHGEGLIHRDVKPGNILIAPRSDATGRDRVYLSDFGLTKRATSESGITATGQFVGTLDYAAPEQFEAKPIDGRADVYSLGCLLYECLTGDVPYPRENQAALVFAHLHSPPPKVTDKLPHLPAAIDDVVATAMAKRPEDRYASAGELAESAAAALGVDVVAPTTPTTPTRPVPGRRRGPSRRAVIFSGTAIAVIIALVVALVVASGGSKAPPSAVIGGAALTDYLVRMDPATSQVVAKIALGQHPIDVAVGEGSVWVLDRDGSVRRIDPVTNKAMIIKVMAEDPRSIAAGEGGVWVADGTKGVVLRIDPASNRVEQPLRTGGVVSDLVAADGAVWAAVNNGTSRIDPSSGEVTDVSGAELGPDSGGGVKLIDVGGGAVWRADDSGSYRYDVATDRLARVETDITPRAISVFGGDAWIASCGTPATVIRLDARTGEVLATVAAGGAICPYFRTGAPIAIAAGVEGVWVTDGANGTISSIRAASGQVDPPIRVGDSPTAIAVGLGSVWVTVDQEPSPSPSTS
jgi:tRNA A-37 threonylcarbamoyl transferase component Bud32